MPTIRRVTQDTLDAARDTDNRMAVIEANFTNIFGGIDGIQDSSNSIYEYLPLLLTSDSFNSQVATVQADYQQLLTGLGTQLTTEVSTLKTGLDSQLVDLDTQVTNIESNLIPTLATLSYQDILHQAETALLTALQSSVDSIINTQLPAFESSQVTIIGGVQSAVDAIAQTQLPAIESSLTTEINSLGTGIATDLLALLQVLNTLTTTANAIPTQTYATELSNLQTDIDAIKSTTSGLPTDRYGSSFNDVQNKLDSIITKQNEAVSVNIPSYSNEFFRIESNQANHSDKLDSIQSKVNSIPTFNPSSSLTSLHDKTDNQAILIGGNRDTSNNIYSDTQAIRTSLNSSLPNLATRNDTNSINNALGTLNSAVAAIPTVNHAVQLNRIEVGSNGANAGVSAVRTETGNIPRVIYNAQLNTIQAHANGANAGVATVRTETANIPRAIYNVPIANAASHAASANAGVATANSKLDQLIAATPISTAVYGDEVIGLLGYTNQEATKFTITASSVLSGSVNQLTNRTDQDFLTQNIANSWVRIDFGTNNASRKITPNAIGLRSRVDNAAHPVNLIIEGSNDASTSPTNWTALYSWSNIGFTAPYQWRLSPSFGNVTAYRHIRIRQPGLDSSGSSNYLGFTELNIYGSTNAL